MARRPADSYNDEEFDAREAAVVDAQIEIHRLLEDKEITQAELARRMGVSEPYVSKLINGIAPNLTLRTYASIMHNLGEDAYIGIASYVDGLKGLNKSNDFMESNVITLNFRAATEYNVDIEDETIGNFSVPLSYVDRQLQAEVTELMVAA